MEREERPAEGGGGVEKIKIRENERNRGGRREERERREEEGTGDGPREDKFCNPLWSAS